MRKIIFIFALLNLLFPILYVGHNILRIFTATQLWYSLPYAATVVIRREGIYAFI